MGLREVYYRRKFPDLTDAEIGAVLTVVNDTCSISPEAAWLMDCISRWKKKGLKSAEFCLEDGTVRHIAFDTEEITATE